MQHRAHLLCIVWWFGGRIWEECSTIHSPSALFLFACLFLKLRLARAHQLHSLGQDLSTVAQRAETTVVEIS